MNRRDRYEQARAAVCDATLKLVEDTAFADLTVDQIARSAGVSRSSFYLYFGDKHDLLMVAAQDVMELLYREAEAWWSGDGDPETQVRQALAGVVGAYTEHVAVLRVAAEVASYDDEVADAWRELIGRFITATARHIRDQQGTGQMQHLDPDATADALIWMVERCCHVHLARAQDEPDGLVESLVGVWMATLYGSSR